MVPVFVYLTKIDARLQDTERSAFYAGVWEAYLQVWQVVEPAPDSHRIAVSLGAEKAGDRGSIGSRHHLIALRSNIDTVNPDVSHSPR